MNRRQKEGSISDIMGKVREAFDHLIVERDAPERAEHVTVKAEHRPRRDDRGSSGDERHGPPRR